MLRGDESTTLIAIFLFCETQRVEVLNVSGADSDHVSAFVSIKHPAWPNGSTPHSQLLSD